MPMRIVVNGREVMTPAARLLAALVVVAMIALLLAVLLPLIGIVVAGTLGVGAVAAGARLLSRSRRRVSAEAIAEAEVIDSRPHDRHLLNGP